MRLGTPRSEQGQMVERAYGWCNGVYYLREHDRSSRTTCWYRADQESTERLQESTYDAGGEDYPPDVDDWTPCAEPRDSDDAPEWPSPRG